MDERKRDSIIAYLRSRMAEFGIIESALAEALAEAPAQAAPFSKTNGTKRTMPQLPSMPAVAAPAQGEVARSSGMRGGGTWDGKGDMPEWLQPCGPCAGSDIEFYRHEAFTGSMPGERPIGSGDGFQRSGFKQAVLRTGGSRADNGAARRARRVLGACLFGTLARMLVHPRALHRRDCALLLHRRLADRPRLDDRPHARPPRYSAKALRKNSMPGRPLSRAQHAVVHRRGHPRANAHAASSAR